MNTRERLLAELKNNIGILVSGEDLSELLNISRAAVSKHVGILKKNGYQIEASPKKGYVLKGLTNLLLPEEIKDGLKTKILGRDEIVYYPIIDSTNNRAKEIAANGAQEGCLVVAEEQSAGRGRKGRTWFSAKGDGICLSLILRPSIPPSEVSQITLMTAVAIAETLLETAKVDIKIKWPNDILINRKKIAGILTEMTMEVDAVDYVVVGLGLNVNNDASSFDDEINAISTSLFRETGRKFSRVQIVRDFLLWFEKYYFVAQSEGFPSIIKRWKELSNTIGKNVFVETHNKQVEGIVQDIGEDGILIVKDSESKLHRIISGDVIFQNNKQ